MFCITQGNDILCMENSWADAWKIALEINKAIREFNGSGFVEVVYLNK